MHKSEPKLAVFPGTFDPLTLGHTDLIHRASSIFDKVLVAVAESPAKHTLFSLSERVQAIKDTFDNYSNIEVIGFTGMLPDLLKEKNAKVLVRGIRTVADYDYEMSLSGMYRMVMPQVEIVMLPASGNLTFVSSTFVRDIIIHRGDISKFAPETVVQLAKKHYSLMT